MDEKKNLTNRKTVLITGASRGIGKSLAEIFAKEGYNLVMLCHNSLDIMWEDAGKLSEEYDVNVYCYATDVSKSDEIGKLFDDLSAHDISIDILINNAGISYVGLLQDMTDKDWDEVIKTNLSGAFYTSRAVLPSMIARKEGRILNISSVWGQTGGSCEVHYSASKAALIGFTKALAKELGLSGICVNCIAPGVIETEMNGALGKETLDELKSEIPLNRIGEAAEVAKTAFFLAGKDADYITGQIIAVNGGMFI